MLKIARIGAVLSLLLAAIVVAGFSLETYLQQTNIDCSTEYKNASEQKETAESAPPLNHLVPSERRQTNATAPKETHYECLIAKYTIELAAFTKVLAYATAALVVATIGLLILGIFQARDMKASIAAAQTSADAADRSARAAIGLELPRLLITPDKIISSETRTGDEIIVSYVVGRVTMANRGRTEAFPVEIKYGMTCADRLPDEPIYTGVETFLPNIIIEPFPPKPEMPRTPEMRLNDCSVIVETGDGARIENAEIGLWFYCCLVYDDFMDTRREVGFCWRWTFRGTSAWRRDGTTAYNRKTQS